MTDETYILDEQIGFILRLVNQRHIGIFGIEIPNLTPTQFAVLAKLNELGAMSQNELGRATAMDAATIKGVVDRLAKRDLVFTSASTKDKRRLLVDLTEAGREIYQRAVPKAHELTRKTLAPLSAAERRKLQELLTKLI